MKIVVHPHELIIGGSPINAIDLAAAVRDLGHEVIVYAVHGPLEDYIATKGLRYVAAPRFRYRPAVSHIAQLAHLVYKERVDLVHAYEWPPCLDAFLGASLLFGVPTLCTVLSMSVMSVVPRVVPLIMGSEELVQAARATHTASVSLIEPPIDTDRDNPANNGGAFRATHGIGPDEFLVVTVSRLAIDLKLDALVDAIDAADVLAKNWPVRLVVVGDGEAALQLSARAAAVNARHRRKVIVLAGAMLDPRPAYGAADIVIGMGGSALRALAHGKPLVVQGEKGFSLPFDEDHESLFFRQGFYGVGVGTPGGPRLAEQLAFLLSDPVRRTALGKRGRALAVGRYSLRVAATKLVRIYEEAIAGRPPRLASLPDAARSSWLAAGIEFRNHLPSLKRARADAELRKLAYATTPICNMPR